MLLRQKEQEPGNQALIQRHTQSHLRVAFFILCVPLSRCPFFTAKLFPPVTAVPKHRHSADKPKSPLRGRRPLALAMGIPNLPRFACADRVIPLPLRLLPPDLRQVGRGSRSEHRN